MPIKIYVTYYINIYISLYLNSLCSIGFVFNQKAICPLLTQLTDGQNTYRLHLHHRTSFFSVPVMQIHYPLQSYLSYNTKQVTIFEHTKRITEPSNISSRHSLITLINI